MTSAVVQPRFAVRVTTVFLVASMLGLGIPVAIGWGTDNGGFPMILAFLVFPWSVAIALVAAAMYLTRRRSLQGWLELGLALGLAALAGFMFL